MTGAPPRLGRSTALQGLWVSKHHFTACSRALRSFLGQNDMMAYLVMMAIRLVEMRRVLKPTGSIYLHCDPTASHYLKLILDSMFGFQT